MDGSAHPHKAAKAVTPMMAQFLEMKKQAGDALLFFRMGDFYELFFDDAIRAAATLDITLTKRGQHNGEDIAMCGVPWHAHEAYLARLIKAGFKVALCEQTESPAAAKKRGAKSVVRREIVRYVTPGTLTEETLLDTRRNNYLVALYVPRAGLPAISWADLSTGEICTRATSTDQFAADLAALAPGEILVSESLNATWHTIIEEAGGRACVTEQSHTVYNEHTAQKRMTDLYGVQSLDAFGNFSKSEISALGALVAYIELTQVGQLPVFKPPGRTGTAGSMVIDAVTRQSLELAQTQKGDYHGSLLSAIDRTVTGPGARTMGTWLASPLTDVNKIRERQNAVQYFCDCTGLRCKMRQFSKKTPDMSRSLSRLALGRGGPRDLAGLRDGLSIAGNITTLLTTHIPDGVAKRQTPSMIERLAIDLHLEADTTSALKVLLEKALAPDLPLFTRDGGFIAPGYDDELDELCDLRDNARRVIAGLEEKYRSLTACKALKVKHNNILGYFIEAPPAQADKLQNSETANTFIHRQTLASAVRFTTVELSDLDAKISRARDGAIARELLLFGKIVEQATAASTQISRCAEALASVDVFAALAELAVCENYCCPKVDDSRGFEILGGRHPVVEQAVKRGDLGDGGQFIPNDCLLTDHNEPCLWLVTGPNMAGKSTFLRQNALLAILAQMGSFVPADTAHIGVIDRVFSRVGASDDLARGRSTFMVEMVETAAILNQATEKSLVVLDEIGRGTATFDGLSIAWAAVEHLHDTNRCRGLFATHYHEITKLSDRLPRLRNFSMKVQEWKQEVIFLHEVVTGPADRSYGVAVARLAGLPSAVVQRAEEVLKLLEEGKVHKHGGVQALVNDLPLFAMPVSSVQEPAFSDLIAMLKEADPDALSPREALDTLYHLRELLKHDE